MSNRTPTNRLSIYLVKKGYTEHKDILKNLDELESIELKNVGRFYYKKSDSFKPTWINNFFHKSLGDDDDLFNASSKGILLVEIDIDKSKRIFAIPFGYGRFFLEGGICEERFGLKTVLNIIDQDSIRKIDRKNMSIVPKNTSEQLAKVGAITHFGIDIEEDLVASITGSSKEDQTDFGERVTGKESLSVSVKRDLRSIKDFLIKCYERYKSNDYKENFPWIDQIAEVKDKKNLDELDNGMINSFKKRVENTWIAVPEVIKWENIKGFRYKERTGELKEDIYIEDFLNSLSDKQIENLNVASLKKKKVYCINSENEEVGDTWKVYNCIYSEIKISDGTFILSNGRWYRIEENFSKKISQKFSEFKEAGCSINLPEYKHENENAYNQAVPEENDEFYCMDRDLISHGGGHSKIEVCDLIHKDKKLIHVKRYGSSNVLGHLFLQGFVSGEALALDEQFRGKVNQKLNSDFKIKNSGGRFKASEYEIIFAIISQLQDSLEIPFFSKVSLLNIKKKLENYGYKVSILKISV